MKKFLILSCLFLFFTLPPLRASELRTYIVLDSLEIFSEEEFTAHKTAQVFVEYSDRPDPVLKRFQRIHKNNRKLTAAILAFPLPFGIVGLHRIYLGTAPYVPVVYIASFGGILGLLPLIDFCCILMDKDLKDFSNNKNVFMWVK